jgi:hypothetical protein
MFNAVFTSGGMRRPVEKQHLINRPEGRNTFSPDVLSFFVLNIEVYQASDCNKEYIGHQHNYTHIIFFFHDTVLPFRQSLRIHPSRGLMTHGYENPAFQAAESHLTISTA